MKLSLLYFFYLLVPLGVAYVAPELSQSLGLSKSRFFKIFIIIYLVIPYIFISFYPSLDRFKNLLLRKVGHTRYFRPIPNDDSPYAILRIPLDATNAEIKQAFHEILKKYHPDLVEQMNPAAKTLALEMTKKVTLAFTQLRKERGF